MIEEGTDVASLIQKAKAQDTAAFAELYRLTIRPVFRYLSAHLDTRDEVEEVSQEVFLAALAGLPRLRADGEPGLMSWLLQIARNKAADHVRRHYRRPAALLEEAREVESAQPPVEDLAEAGEVQALVRVALRRLTPDQREVITCKYLLGYDNERTATVVGKNVNAVNQLHHRALASLHRLLQESDGLCR